MSTQRMAILAAVYTHNLMKNTTTDDKSISSSQPKPNGTEFHGNVKILISGYVV